LDGLPCFLLRTTGAGDDLEWWELVEDVRRVRPFDFEFHFGASAERDVYHAKHVASALRTGRDVIARLRGFQDLYVPVAKSRREGLVFYAGQWARAVPSYEAIAAEWLALSGRHGTPTDATFRRYVRCCLDVNVLDEPLVIGLTRLAKLLAKLVSGAATPRTLTRIEALRRQIFLPRAVDHNWVGSVLDLEGLTVPPWGLDDRLDPRLGDELGLTHPPTVIGVLFFHEDARARLSELESWVQGRRLQQDALRLGRALPGVVVAPLGDRGVIVALAIPPGHRGAARAAHARRTLGALQSALRREGYVTVAGLGGERPPEEGAGPSYRQASYAATLAAERGPGALLSWQDMAPAGRERSGHSRVRHNVIATSRLDLAERLEQLAAHVRNRRPDGLVQEGLSWAREMSAHERMGTPAVRAALVAFTARMAGELVRGQLLERARARELVERHEEQLNRVAVAATLLDVFAAQLAEHQSLVAQGSTADRVARVSAALNWLESVPAAPEPLEQAAAMAGLAPSSFRRLVREHTGQSFASWLRARRVEAGRHLLLSSDAPVRHVAHTVGFGEVHAFIRAFREQRGVTPQAYRKRGR
jgi:AraC-like DNA-binding protein